MATFTLTPDQDTIQVETFIAAPRDRVFRALTEQVAQWWGQPGLYRVTHWESDFRVGGRWRSRGIDASGKEFEVSGVYREIVPPRSLVYTWEPSWGHPVPTLVRFELEEEGSGTRVRLQHSGFAAAPGAAADHGNGWVRVFGWMQAFVERGETIDTRPADSQ